MTVAEYDKQLAALNKERPSGYITRIESEYLLCSLKVKELEDKIRELEYRWDSISH